MTSYTTICVWSDLTPSQYVCFVRRGMLCAQVACDCDACLIPAHQVTEGLKRCMRCKCVAYCSKSCQVAHWKQQHRPMCDKMWEAAEQATIAKARAHLVQRELRISHQSLIHCRAAYKSGIMERLWYHRSSVLCVRPKAKYTNPANRQSNFWAPLWCQLTYRLTM